MDVTEVEACIREKLTAANARAESLRQKLVTEMAEHELKLRRLSKVT